MNSDCIICISISESHKHDIEQIRKTRISKTFKKRFRSWTGWPMLCLKSSHCSTTYGMVTVEELVSRSFWQ